MYTKSDTIDGNESIVMKKSRKEKGNGDRGDPRPFIGTGTIPTFCFLCSLPRVLSQADNYIPPLPLRVKVKQHITMPPPRFSLPQLLCLDGELLPPHEGMR